MNIIYLNHYAGSIHHGMEYRPYYLAEEWQQQGHNVTIVASSFSHLRQKNITLQAKQSYLYEQLDGINYIWCKTKPYKENGIRRVLNIFEFLSRVKKIIPELIALKPDVIIASSTYPFDTYVANKIAKKTGAKFVYEIHDLWPLTPIELGGMSKYHPFIWLMQRAENFGYKNADNVVSLLPCAKDYMIEHGMQANKFIYIPNGVRVSDWLNNKDGIPLEHQKIITQARAKFSLLIGYAGGMGKSNALSYLVEAAQQCAQVAFILVGDGANRQQLITRTSKLGLDNIFILPSIKKAQIPNFLSQMDILYIGWHKLSIYRFGICPNKMFDYMLAKKPILHSVTAGNDPVQEANCGISVMAEDIEAIVVAVKQFQNMGKEQLVELGQYGYDYVIKQHDYAVLATKFLQAII